MAGKTIEIISNNIGPVNICTRKDEQRTVVFQQVDMTANGQPIGRAIVDEDEAAIFMEIGRPFYWKQEAVEITTDTKTTNTGQIPAAALIAQIKAATTAEEVDALIADDSRKTVIEAAATRKAELSPPDDSQKTEGE